MIKRTYRMMGLVPYNLSPIQQAIQFGHGVANSYQIAFGGDEDYKQWAIKDMTIMILNGGTTNKRLIKEGIPFGTLNQHSFTLSDMEIKHACFYEPDLGDQLTAVVFLVDERVWDHKGEYLDFKYDEDKFHIDPVATKKVQYELWLKMFSRDPEEAEKIVEIRAFLKQFRLA